MANELVIYEPELNTIPLKDFTPVEMNMFFSIVSRMRNKNDQVISFSFEQLKDLSNYKPTANNRFINDIQSTYEKLMRLNFGSRSKTGLTREFFSMFTRFKINGDAPTPYVEVQIHEMAIPLLNNLDTWVRYSLSDFRDLNSSYAKTMFRLLKQYRTTGYAEFSKTDFFEQLDIPKSYWAKQANIQSRVLVPIKEELTPLFKGLTIRKKYGKGRGKPVIGYKFAWKPENKNADDFSKGALIDQKIKIDNVNHNSELSREEKWRSIDRIKNLPLGSTETLEKATLDLENSKSELLENLRKRKNK